MKRLSRTFKDPVSGLTHVASAAAALAAFAGLKAAPLFLRGALPVLLAGLGVALAFGEINGKTPEAWFLDWLAFVARNG